jgi:hypothetical protein
MRPDEETVAAAEGQGKKNKPKVASKILTFVQGIAQGGVNTARSADRLGAFFGSKDAKDRLGVVSSRPNPPTGPVRFPARFRGEKGHAYLDTAATTPALSWTAATEDSKPRWTVPIGDIHVSST